MQSTRQRTIDYSIQCSLPIYQRAQHKISFKCNGTLINCQSVTDKTQDIQLEITENILGIYAFTKTWIKEGKDITSLELCPSGYKAISIPWKRELKEDLQSFTKNP